MAKKTDLPARPPRPARGALSEEDRRVFEAAMADARRLARPDEAPPPEAPAAVPARTRAPPRPEPARTQLPRLEAGLAAGLDGRTMDRLRRGRIRPEGRLDLHGMTRAEAHRALAAFIARAAAEGRRCVVVITGKGRISEGGGVLRNEVPGWLNAPAIRPAILAFAEAQPKDGGAGALYVLLRRAREKGAGGPRER